ncbi:MAG: glutamate racemase [Saprospiraceae bacterium]|nr:glutamate racemase [Saprospiraceae bacterium]
MKAEARRPIGIFDSGIGGLTVASAIHKLLPQESFIYFGDTAHLPYGEKSHDAIRYFSLRICKFLLEKNCKAIVVACNSASTAAYEVLLDFFKEKAIFVNVVDPLVDHCCSFSFTNIGLIATHATVQSGVYDKQFKKRNAQLKLKSLATPLLAPMIEEGFVNNTISHSVIENYLSDPILDGIEALLLACTHYPLIKQEIAEFYNPKIPILDSTNVTAMALKTALKNKDLLCEEKIGEDQFFVSDYSENFLKTTKLFYPEAIDLKRMNIWE